MPEEQERDRQIVSYTKWLIFLTIIVIFLMSVQISPIFKGIKQFFVYEPDFVIALSEETTPFDNSILNEESFIYTISPKLEVNQDFKDYSDIKCSFSYENIGKKQLKNSVLKIYLIDPIDRVIAYKEETGISSQEKKFTFKEGSSHIREIKGNVRILITIWSEENELAGYALFECQYKEEEGGLIAFIILYFSMMSLTFLFILRTRSGRRFLRVYREMLRGGRKKNKD